MRTARRLAFALLCVLAASCSSGKPVEVPVSTTAEINVRINLQTTAITGVVVEVTAPDISSTLVFNLTVSANTATGTIQVPVGSNRTITVRAFDAAGHETHHGSAVISVVN